MRQLLITSVLLLTILLLYRSVIEGERGLKGQLEHSKQHTSKYIRGIDS